MVLMSGSRWGLEERAGTNVGASDDHERTMTHTRIRMAAPAVHREEVAHYLVMIAGGEPGRRIQLRPGTMTLGRDTARDLVLADPDVSRLHARISVRDDRVIVEDQHSTNGTFIDGQAVTGPAVLVDGSILAVGQQVLKLERRSKQEVERSEELRRDLDRASQYVRSLLPAPIADGPIRTDWLFQPSAQLGGDAFGYDQLDADTFAMYLIDVSGHGVGAAMHSVSVLSVLRQRALLDADLREPAEVLASLNTMFQMDRHDGMFFTMWYGVYHIGQRLLRFASAGHHPSYLVTDRADTPGRRGAMALRTRGLMLGAMPQARFSGDQTIVPPNSSLYLFSDGVFEIVTKDLRQWRLDDFTPLLVEPSETGTGGEPLPESQRLYRAVKAAARPGPFDDDVSLLVVTFA
jgi:serine phosphatase RsbU (regulator of sigma subunit)